MDKPFALVSLASLAIAFCPAAALASGFETARMAGEHGNPVTTNPSAIYYNPAGLAESEGTNIYAEYYLALRGASYTHTPAATDCGGAAASCPAPPAGANDGKATLFNAVGAPFLGVSTKIHDLALGAAFYVPFGGTETWNQNAAFAGSKTLAGPVDGTQRWYSINGTIQSLYFSGAIAYKIPGTGLSLGATGSVIASSLDVIRARTAVGNDDVTSEGRAVLDVSGIQGGFTAGAMYEAMPKKLWFGASYESRPNVSGGMRLHGTLQTYFGSPPVNPGLPVDVLQDLPDIVRVGARFRASEKLELRLYGDWERWSAFQNQCIVNPGGSCPLSPDGSSTAMPAPQQNLPRDWNDGFGIHSGASYWVSEGFELFGGVGYDSAATPLAHLEPDLMDLSSLTLAAGANVALGSHVKVGLQYSQLIFFSVDTTGVGVNSNATPCTSSPAPGCSYAGSIVPPAAGSSAVSAGPSAQGQYSQWIGLINAHVEATF